MYSQLTDKCNIIVNGAQITTSEMNNLSFLEVDLTVDMPSICVIEFHDDNAAMIDGNKFDIGKTVKIEFARRDAQQMSAIFNGEIVVIEPIFNQNSVTLRIVAFDKLHRLNNNNKLNSFVNVTDSDVISNLAQTNGLSAAVTATSTLFPIIIQDNISDLDFMRYLTRRNGFSLYIRPSDGNLIIESATTTDSGVVLKRGNNLQSFLPRISTAQQVTKVTVMGWDYVKKTNIVGISTTPVNSSPIGYDKDGKTVVNSNFSARPLVEYHSDVINQGLAEKMAQARFNEINGQFLVAEGQCFGDSRIMPNSRLEIKQVGTKFSGKYCVTRVVHRYDLDQGYLCDFTVEGRAASTTADLISSTPLEMPQLWHGVYSAIVTNNNDPDQLGRVKVKFPWLSDTVETFWARVVYPGAGNSYGLFNVPEVNDEVLVAFEAGNFNSPLIIGGLYNGKDKPPVNAIANNKVEHRVWKTRIGHELHFYDKDSDKKIELKTAGGYSLTLDETNDIITLIDKAKNSIVIDGASKKISITSKGDIELSGNNIKMNAKASVEIKGTTIKLN